MTVRTGLSTLQAPRWKLRSVLTTVYLLAPKAAPPQATSMCRTARPSPPATTAGPAATLVQRSNHLTLLEGPAHSLWAKAATSFGDNLRALVASAKNGRIAHVLATRILSGT